MQNFQFFILLLDNLWLYFFSLIICTIPIFIIAKKYTRSWIDPLRIGLLFVAFANTVPLFLFLINEIPIYLFCYFILSETLFWIGFVWLAKKEIKFSSKKIINEIRISNLLYFIFFVLYVSFTTFSYLKFGIPIFAESRLATFFDSGGFGVLARLNSFFILYILMYSYFILDKKKSLFYRLFSILVFITIATTGILSGSRSGFLMFIYAYFGYQYFFKKTLPKIKKVLKYAPIILSGAIIVLLITTQGSINNAFIALGSRVIASGDVYWMAFPNEIFKNLNVGNNFTYLFSGFLGPLRIIDYSSVSPPIGAQLTWTLIPSLQGIMVGPNGRAPVLGYVMFGWGGLIFSFILGIFTSVLIFRTAKIFPEGFISSVFVFYIYMNAQHFIGDSPLGITYLFDILLNLFFVFFAIVVLGVLIKKVDRNHCIK